MTVEEFRKLHAQFKSSELERRLALRISTAGLPRPRTQYRPFKHRKYTFDFAWPEQRVLLEVQGSYGKDGHEGGHRSITGFKRDCDKFSMAAAYGWRVLVVERNMIQSGKAVALLKRALNWRKNEEGDS